jgi:hypothetical protein
MVRGQAPVARVSRVAPILEEASCDAYCRTACTDDSDIVTLIYRARLLGLEASAVGNCWSRVTGRCIAFEKFIALQIVDPDAKGVTSDRLAIVVMAGVPIPCESPIERCGSANPILLDT